MVRVRTLRVATAFAAGILGASPAEGADLLVPRNGGEPIAIRSHRVTARVEDGIARTHVKQVFVNPQSRPLEAIYSFPLPEDASIVELSMTVADQRLEGLLAERREARRVYDSLVRRDKDPALLEQVGRSLYRLSVFPVMPAVETVIELTYVEPCAAIAGEVRYVYPLASQRSTATVERDFTATVEFATSARLLAIESPIEGMSTTALSEREGRASFEESKARLDRDLVVVARIATETPAMKVHTWRAPGGDAYFAAVLTAPRIADAAVIPRDFTFVLDVSGSMKGEKMAQAKRAVQWWIEQLGPRDRANLVLFSDVTRRFAEDPVDATPENRRALDEFISAAQPAGGTDLSAAVRAAGRHQGSEGRLAVSVLLTDGLPTSGETSATAIVSLAREAGDHGLVLHSFGIGEDVDPVLLDAIATAAHGSSEVLRTVGDVEQRLRAFLTRIGAPAIHGTALRIGGRLVDDTFPKAPYTIIRGEQFVITGRCGTAGEATIELDADFDDAALTMKAGADFGSPDQRIATGSIVARDLYAKQRLASLERVHRLRLGLDDAAYHAAVGAGRYDTKDEVIAAMIDVSLETGVQCAFTSFLALLPEDRQRLNPHDQGALQEALKRVAERRRVLASGGSSADPADSVASDSRPHANGFDGFVDSGDGGFLSGATAKNGAKATPGHGRPSGGGGGGGPNTPGAGPATGGGGSMGKKLPRPESFDSWKFWWEYNKERFFDPRPRVDDGDSRIASHDVTGPTPYRLTADDVENRIVPLLKSTLAEDDMDILDSAILALGRVLPASDAPLAFDDIVAKLESRYRLVQQSAILALGVLGAREAAPLLVEILIDSTKGRELLNLDAPVPDLHRSFAALALGYLGANETIPALKTAFESPGAGSRSVRASVLVALGLFEEGRDEIVAFLRDSLRDATLDEDTRGQIPIALARLGDRSSIAVFVTLATDPKTADRVRESAIIALGSLAEANDRDVIESLSSIMRDAPNDQDRHFAIIALADVAERALRGDLAGNREIVAAIRASLLSELRKRQYAQQAPWAGLALAIVGRALPIGSADRVEIEQALLEKFREETNPSILPAYALALGVVDAKVAAAEIQKLMLDTNELDLKGYCAVALGFLKHRDAQEPLRKYLLDDRDPRLRLQVATALGLMGDTGSIDLLVDAFARTKSLNGISSLARAIGLIGDRRAIDPLDALIRDRSSNGLARGFGCVALGMLAEKFERPWNTRISIGINYRTQVVALKEALDIL